MLAVVELVMALSDWISMTLLMEDGGLLLQLLIEMLTMTEDVTVQLSAADCLLAITGRKVGTHTVYVRTYKNRMRSTSIKRQ